MLVRSCCLLLLIAAGYYLQCEPDLQVTAVSGSYCVGGTTATFTFRVTPDATTGGQVTYSVASTTPNTLDCSSVTVRE